MLPEGTIITITPHLVEGRQSDPFGKACGPFYLVTGRIPEGDTSAGITATPKGAEDADPAASFTYIDASYTKLIERLEREQATA